MLAAEAGAGGRLVGGALLDLLEEPRPLLLLEMRAERAAERVEAGGHDVGAARGVRRGPREGLLHLGEQGAQRPVLLDDVAHDAGQDGRVCHDASWTRITLSITKVSTCGPERQQVSKRGKGLS